MSRQIQINKIATLNRETFKKNEFPISIKYLDTGNLTRNSIKTFKLLNITKDKIPSRAQRKIKANTILYSTVRPNQEHFGIFEKDCNDLVVSTGFTTIDVVDKEISPKYLYYLLTQKHITDYLHTIGMNAVSAYPSISPDDIGKLNFRVPVYSNQKSIANVLSHLDAKIELNNKINAELESMAKLIYDYWFVQFDFPDAKGNPYKSSGGPMIYNKELKKEIPDGWKCKSLLHWINNNKSGDWGKKDKQGNYTERVSCIRGTDIDGLNGKENVKPPLRYILNKNKHKILENGDLIVEISGGSPVQSTGRLGFITIDTLKRFSTPLICSNFCKVVTLKEEKMLFNFVYLWKRLYENGLLFRWEGKTSGIKNLLFESFITNFKTQIPPLGLMAQFFEKMQPIHSNIQINLQVNQHLTKLRDWLLPMLLNGQVTVERAVD